MGWRHTDGVKDEAEASARLYAITAAMLVFILPTFCMELAAHTPGTPQNALGDNGCK